MPRRIRLYPYLCDHDFHDRYRHVCESVELSRWQFLWLLGGKKIVDQART
ncbi:MAG TPA: hypothetical protein VGF38_09830 [Ktedonobacterales bacterium]